MNRAVVFCVAVLYLAFVVAANLIVADQGPQSVLYVSFFLVGPVLTTRDFLHEAWGGTRASMWVKMGLLIAAGSAISYIASPNAGDVALASCLAFAAAGALDTIIYAALEGADLSTRVNVSNIFSAAVDSLIFPTIAFHDVIFRISFEQWVAKIAGGAVWLVLAGALAAVVTKDRLQPELD